VRSSLSDGMPVEKGDILLFPPSTYCSGSRGRAPCSVPILCGKSKMSSFLHARTNSLRSIAYTQVPIIRSRKHREVTDP
jgi:hypothetical protein